MPPILTSGWVQILLTWPYFDSWWHKRMCHKVELFLGIYFSPCISHYFFVPLNCSFNHNIFLTLSFPQFLSLEISLTNAVELCSQPRFLSSGGFFHYVLFWVDSFDLIFWVDSFELCSLPLFLTDQSGGFIWITPQPPFLSRFLDHYFSLSTVADPLLAPPQKLLPPLIQLLHHFQQTLLLQQMLHCTFLYATIVFSWPNRHTNISESTSKDYNLECFYGVRSKISETSGISSSFGPNSQPLTRSCIASRLESLDSMNWYPVPHAVFGKSISKGGRGDLVWKALNPVLYPFARSQVIIIRWTTGHMEHIGGLHLHEYAILAMSTRHFLVKT